MRTVGECIIAANAAFNARQLPVAILSQTNGRLKEVPLASVYISGSVCFAIIIKTDNFKLNRKRCLAFDRARPCREAARVALPWAEVVETESHENTL
jgi:hypothetical protein